MEKGTIRQRGVKKGDRADSAGQGRNMKMKVLTMYEGLTWKGGRDIIIVELERCECNKQVDGEARLRKHAPMMIFCC